jgi:hypothetical protein
LEVPTRAIEAPRMARERCGATTKTDGHCRYPAAECPYKSHRIEREANARKSRDVSAQPPDDAHRPAGLTPPPAVDEHDLHGLGWWTIRNAITGDLETPRAAVVATVMRVLAGLGPEPMEEQEALRDVELLGVIMHGVPPRSAAEWERAHQLFDADAIEEFERWVALGEGDGLDSRQPFRRGDRRRDEVQVPFVVEDEDGA